MKPIVMSAVEKNAIRDLLREALCGEPSVVLQGAILKFILVFVRAQSVGLLEVKFDGD